MSGVKRRTVMNTFGVSMQQVKACNQ